jgi:glycosyltransferase involved in cell wall biosynthesis
LRRRYRRYRRPDLWLREIAVIHQYRTLLAKARNDPACAALFDTGRAPLVTVRIATYNRGAILVERTLPTVLAQTYPHLEVLIVGDHCTDDTEARLRRMSDPRIRFINLPERGRYPETPWKRWMVAGAAPMNYALGVARGEWIAPLDDDDEFTPEHVATMLDACRRERWEMAFGIARMQLPWNAWSEVGSLPLRPDHICHSAAFYWSGLRFMPHEWNAWKLGEPGDWNLWRRMRSSGVRIGFVPKVVTVHHQEYGAWGR